MKYKNFMEDPFSYQEDGFFLFYLLAMEVISTLIGRRIIFYYKSKVIDMRNMTNMTTMINVEELMDKTNAYALLRNGIRFQIGLQNDWAASYEVYVDIQPFERIYGLL